MGSHSPISLSSQLRGKGGGSHSVSLSLEERRWAHTPPSLSLPDSEEGGEGGIALRISLSRREEMGSHSPISSLLEREIRSAIPPPLSPSREKREMGECEPISS